MHPASLGVRASAAAGMTRAAGATERARDDQPGGRGQGGGRAFSDHDVPTCPRQFTGAFLLAGVVGVPVNRCSLGMNIRRSSLRKKNETEPGEDGFFVHAAVQVRARYEYRDSFSRIYAVAWGSAPAPGAVVRALADHLARAKIRPENKPPDGERSFG